MTSQILSTSFHSLAIVLTGPPGLRCCESAPLIIATELERARCSKCWPSWSSEVIRPVFLSNQVPSKNTPGLSFMLEGGFTSLWSSGGSGKSVKDLRANMKPELDPSTHIKSWVWLGRWISA